MKVIGLTGSFGSGKSFVASLFKSYGAKVLDADTIAHRAMRKGTPAYRKIVRAFGAGVLSRSGSIDRRALGRIVFDDTRRLAALENILHPEVIRTILAGVAAARAGKPVVIDAPLLIEANLAGVADCLVVVTAARKRQIERCAKKFGLTPAEIRKRIDSQIPLSVKTMIADHVIDNNGTKRETAQQARKVWCRIWKSRN